ncbi:autotransporter domain-containing protein [Kushneria sp. TE3]|uniref:autotransporter domain-containing protein n=1 Tax=Kushneria sp. TE3 TaxID=3449832 RepID=UPI003F68483E
MDIPYIYQLQEASYESLQAQHFSVAVVDMDDTGLSRAQVEAIQARDKTLITYVSIGEAEDYRNYWQAMSAEGVPDYVFEENDSWRGNYRVAFWRPEWQQLMLERIEEAVALGYSGAYLDIVDAYTLESVQARYTGEDLRAEMEKFVIRLSKHAKSLNPDFLIIPQNAVGLLGISEDMPGTPNRPYLAAIDGVGVEDLWYDDDRPSPWTESDLEFLRTALAEGRFILSTSYPGDEANQAAYVEAALREGLLPYVATRELDDTYAPVNATIATRPVITFPLATPEGYSGRLGDIAAAPAFLRSRLGFAERRPALIIERNTTAFAALATSDNARAAATSADRLGFGNALYDALVSRDAATAAHAFDQLPGEVHAATPSAIAQDALQIQSLMRQRLARDTTGDAGDGIVVWSQGYGSKSELDGNPTGGFQRRGHGLAVGIDAAPLDDWRVGALVGSGESRVRMDGMDARADLDHTYVGAYARHDLGATTLSLGAAYLYSDAESRRRVRFTGFDNDLEADYSARTILTFAELSRHLSLGPVTLEPFAGVSYLSVDVDDVRETGGAAALSAEGNRASSGYTTLGLRHDQRLPLGGLPLTLQGEAAWQRRLNDSPPRLDAAFTDGERFTVKGAGPGRDALRLRADLGLALGAHSTLSVGYVGHLDDDVSDHGASATLDFRF